MTTENLRAVVREEVARRADLTDEYIAETVGRLSDRMDKRFKAVEGRLGAVEERLAGVESAVVFMARQFPGTVPSERSHVERGVRERVNV